MATSSQSAFGAFSLLWTRVAAAVVLGLSLSAVGCGGKSPAAASGAIAIGGKPTAGVYVVLSPIDGAKKEATRTGRTDDAGNFVIEVPEAGEYALTLFWPKVTKVLGEETEGEDQFKGRHRDPQNPVSKVTLRAGENTIPSVELKRP